MRPVSLRALAAATSCVAMLAVAGCSSTVDGHPTRVDGGGGQEGAVDTSKFEGLLTECQIVTPKQLADAVGGTSVDGTFNGAICRWVVRGTSIIDVTLAWYEWGDFNLEKQTTQRMGFTTENIQVNGVAAFTATDPKRPSVCGVTAKSPGRGTITWWVEPEGAVTGDPCQGPTKLMELVISRAS